MSKKSQVVTAVVSQAFIEVIDVGCFQSFRACADALEALLAVTNT